MGAGRTAEEIGRAFPGIPVINSSGRKVRVEVPDQPALVIATPGAEPFCRAGYGAALLLDGSAMLARPDLRAAEETLRRWMAAAALVRSATAGGRVVIGADASLPSVQALIRWDPVGHAAAELAARRELGFPPAAAMASIEGDEQAVLEVLDRLPVPPDGEVLGPVALDDLGADDEAPAPPSIGRKSRSEVRSGRCRCRRRSGCARSSGRRSRSARCSAPRCTPLRPVGPPERRAAGSGSGLIRLTFSNYFDLKK